MIITIITYPHPQRACGHLRGSGPGGARGRARRRRARRSLGAAGAHADGCGGANGTVNDNKHYDKYTDNTNNTNNTTNNTNATATTTTTTTTTTKWYCKWMREGNFETEHFRGAESSQSRNQTKSGAAPLSNAKIQPATFLGSRLREESRTLQAEVLSHGSRSRLHLCLRPKA